ncbi:MAG: RDD family protein, partial [SAR202 cluster bacterium]|nr:RDD family protein [SAR202 cluster bacterium]
TFADRRILNRFSLEEPPKAGTPFVVLDGYEVPTAMRRASAAITDIAVVMVLFIVIALVAAGAGEAGTEEYENTLAGLLVLLFIGCPAFWIFAATEGWSIGKLAVGLRLFGFDGETTGFGA